MSLTHLFFQYLNLILRVFPFQYQKFSSSDVMCCCKFWILGIYFNSTSIHPLIYMYLNSERHTTLSIFNFLSTFRCHTFFYYFTINFFTTTLLFYSTVAFQKFVSPSFPTSTFSILFWFSTILQYHNQFWLQDTQKKYFIFNSELPTQKVMSLDFRSAALFIFNLLLIFVLKNHVSALSIILIHVLHTLWMFIVILPESYFIIFFALINSMWMHYFAE